MAEDVVKLPRRPRPLLGDAAQPLFPMGAAFLGQLLAPPANRLRADQHHEQPCHDADIFLQRWLHAPADDGVENDIRDQTNQGADPGGDVVPELDGGEERDDQADECRAVRIAEQVVCAGQEQNGDENQARCLPAPEEQEGANQ